MLYSTASRKLQVCCTAAAVGIGAYRLFLPSLDCGFTFDDHLGVVNNADVDTSRTAAADSWSRDIWGKSLLAHDSHKSWRPLLVFTFRLSHAAAEGFDAAAFHLPSLWLHSCVSALLVPLAMVVLKCDLETAAFVAATFAVHPVHVEGVTSVVNRAEPLATLFAILARFAFEFLVQGFNNSSASLDVDDGAEKEDEITQETNDLVQEPSKPYVVETDATASAVSSAPQLPLSKAQPSPSLLRSSPQLQPASDDASPPAIFVAGLSWETTAAELEALCVQVLSREINRSSDDSGYARSPSNDLVAHDGVSVDVEFLTNRSKKSGSRKHRSLGCAVVRLHLSDTPELVLEAMMRRTTSKEAAADAATAGFDMGAGEASEMVPSLLDERSLTARWAAAVLNGSLLNGRELAVREERVDRRTTGFQADRATRAADDALLGLLANDIDNDSTTSDNLLWNGGDVDSSTLGDKTCNDAHAGQNEGPGDGLDGKSISDVFIDKNSASLDNPALMSPLLHDDAPVPTPVPTPVLAMFRRSSRTVAQMCFFVWNVGCLLVCLTLSVLSKETGLTVGAILVVVDLLRDPLPVPSSQAPPPLSVSSTHEEHSGQVRTEPQGTIAERDIDKATHANDNSVAAAAAHKVAVVRWHWICVGLRASLLALFVAVYLFTRTHVMTPGGLLELPSPEGGPPDSSSRGSYINSGNESSNPAPQWRIAWERAAWGSISLETSGLIRKAENPYSLLPPRSLASILSLGHLHFRYAWLLVFPRTLSAEYSFDCIPKVSSIWDERNFGTFAAYGTLVALWLYALWKPRARRSLSEALTWGCLPFVPASGVLARLGTLLAERLLYLPSIGYCLLLGWLINATEEITVIPEDTSATPGSASSNENTTAASPTGNGTPVKLSPPRDTSQNRRHNSNNTSSKDHVKKRRLVAVRALAWVGVGLLAQRTRQRIPDWATDWTLFHAAQEACPTSAKTRHQIGQLWLNQRKDTAVALSHFEAAFALDPDFCDSEYSISLARMQLGDFSPSTMAMLRRSLHCVYVASSAFVNIQHVWRFLLNQPSGRNNGTLLEEIGDTLAEVVEGAEAQSQDFDHDASLANHNNATASAASKGLLSSWWQLASKWVKGDNNNDGAKAGGVDFSGFSSVDLDQVSDSSSNGGESSSSDSDDSSGDSGSANGGVLMSALENLQAAGIAHLNAQKPFDAARALAHGLVLAQEHGGGDLAKVKTSHRARKEVPTADYQCRFRYWLARAQVDLAGAAAASNGAAAAVGGTGTESSDGSEKSSKGQNASKKRKAKKAETDSKMAVATDAAGAASTPPPITAATREAVKLALAEALKHLNVAANPKRCDAVKIATPSAAVREQVRSLARNFS